MVLLHDVGYVEAHCSHLEIVLILTQDRNMVCVECGIGSEIVLGTPDGTSRCYGSSGSSFRSV
jgi:hypothetical protein